MGPSKIKVQFHACFQSFTNCPSREATRVICETLKTQVKLNLILRGANAITC